MGWWMNVKKNIKQTNKYILLLFYIYKYFFFIRVSRKSYPDTMFITTRVAFIYNIKENLNKKLCDVVVVEWHCHGIYNGGHQNRNTHSLHLYDKLLI